MLLKQEPKIIFPRPIENATLGVVKDIVFGRPNEKTYSFAFALGVIKSSTELSVEELFALDNDNLEEGLGVYKITGEIGVLANNEIATNAVLRLVGQRLHAHILYTDGLAMSIPFRSSTGDGLDYKAAQYSYLIDRYPEIETYAPLLGVKLRVLDSVSGKKSQLRLSITGITLDRFKYRPASDNDFYKSIPNLDRGLKLKPHNDATGKTGGTIGL